MFSFVQIYGSVLIALPAAPHFEPHHLHRGERGKLKTFLLAFAFAADQKFKLKYQSCTQQHEHFCIQIMV
jgi:hypothetical protein